MGKAVKIRPKKRKKANVNPAVVEHRRIQKGIVQMEAIVMRGNTSNSPVRKQFERALKETKRNITPLLRAFEEVPTMKVDPHIPVYKASV